MDASHGGLFLDLSKFAKKNYFRSKIDKMRPVVLLIPLACPPSSQPDPNIRAGLVFRGQATSQPAMGFDVHSAA
jgi:hypothetical protein